jgi:hypothetical protein
MKIFLKALLLFLPTALFAQSSYIPLNRDYYYLLDRYEVLNGRQSQSYHSSSKPIEREALANFLDSLSLDSGSLSKADYFNLEYLKNDNWEWTGSEYNDSRKPVLKYFYRKKSDLFHVHNEDFDLHVNPVLYIQLGKESPSGEINYLNTRGIEVRGMIDKKIGFYSFFADNQARVPQYVKNFIEGYNSVPGEGFFKPFKENGIDFLTARGYFTFNITKHIHFQFGHDKNFIGNGYRSLILSDFASNYTFLKINTKIWKINYTNLFTEMNAGTKAANDLFPKKYLAFHHLSFNVSKNLNIGVFESVVFGRKDTLRHGQFDFNYLNPIIFFRSIEQQLGSSDNAILGMDYKWNFLKHFSFYGQIILDEFFLKHVKAGDGWWANKQAFQIGLKYFNAAGIKNLDLQGEFNIVRPYTYAHASKYTNYSHYNQPLAHPVGANFYELIGIARYQPLKRLHLTSKLFYIKTGLDSNFTNTGVGQNYGGNVNKSYIAVGSANTFGNRIGQGIATDIIFLSFNASYQLRHNLFIDFTQVIRKETSAVESRSLNTSLTSVGLRWNIGQRLHEF